MALTEEGDLNIKRGRASRTRHLFDRTSHSRSRARRSCGNRRIRRFRDRTVCILRISNWQTNPYPVVFLEYCHAISYMNGTRSLSGTRVLTFPGWFKDHEVLESSVSVSCRLFLSMVISASGVLGSLRPQGTGPACPTLSFSGK
jgi:hypothetical protein